MNTIFSLKVKVAGGSPAAAYFLLSGQEKVGKENAAPVRRSCGLPCAARRVGRLRNSPLSETDKGSDSARRFPRHGCAAWRFSGG